MLDSVSVWQGSPAVSTQAENLEGSRGSVKRVPGSKEEVFKDKTVGLVDKRRLMKFLMFAAGNFEQDEILQGESAIYIQTLIGSDGGRGFGTELPG